jgi:hypothetical protein
MTITLLPRGTALAETTSLGKLATTLLSVAVAGMAEGSRFRRGRAYAAERAVTRIDLEPGSLQATVVGSRSEPYRVVIDVPLMSRTGSGAVTERSEVILLTPDVDDLDVRCTCPDGVEPCKHVVATLLAFAAELGARPELLVEWRSGSTEPAPRVSVGSRSRSERHLRLAPPPPPPSPFRTPGWAAFEGHDLPPVPTLPDELATATAAIASAVVDRVDVAAVIRSALEALDGSGVT